MMDTLVYLFGDVAVVYSAIVSVAVVLAMLFGPWREHTAASRVLASEVSDALTATGKHGALTHLIGMNHPKLSRALNVGEPLNLWRLASLPDAFWLELCERIVNRCGGLVIRPEHVAVFKGAAVLGVKKMAVMGIGFDAERRQA